MEKAVGAKAVSSLFSDRFKQQQLPAWRPLFTPKPVLSALWFFSAVLLGLALAAIVCDQDVREVVIHYDSECSSSSCVINHTLEKPLRLPLYVYYELDNYYQNYRLYAKSRNQEQLEGKQVNKLTDLSDCAPMDSLNHLNKTEFFYFPCGLIAYSFFNDSFRLSYSNDNHPVTSIPLRKNGIAWKPDRDMYNSNPTNVTGIRVIDNITDEDFLVWMRVAAFPRFRKLYRIIDKNALDNGTTKEISGTLIIDITNIYNVSSFGNKSLVITELSWLGGKNAFIGWLLLAVGAVYFICSIFFTCKQVISPRKFADTRLLPWSTNGSVEYQTDEFDNVQIIEVAQVGVPSD